MDNDLKDIDAAFETGDVYVFELSQFEDLTDPNLQKLAQLFKSIEKTFFNMIDLNQIDEEDIENY